MDNYDELQYNDTQDTNDDDSTQVIVEKIKKEDMTAITVEGCSHTQTTRKPSDEFDNCIEVTCNDCPLGWFIRS
jgi:hypothetical protein